ncbi:helix-turn-helix domain-containing protein [Pelistega sp. NLN82]|uniref:Helix-turn-helix domain-containing protein n=1 Tax=Pelistega ratti TaxID=2652177 RepID=A0A6L9Y7S5_9BURK|nr:helix-turn-helix domain-containing protein [Pelistega ratti]NEN75887.1 helix-turn-helix domain-containing protein [Pelistega ratti]
MTRHIALNKDSIHCANCMLGRICMPQKMNLTDIEHLTELIKERIRVAKGEYVFHIGNTSGAIYSIRTGAIKTQVENNCGHTQITGFFLPGEVFGLDSFTAQQHTSDAIALEDSEVCVMYTKDLNIVAQQIPSLQAQFRHLLSGEIIRSHQLLLSLGSLRSDQRVAWFILDMSARFTQLGYSSNEFILRMSREDIGNYLGLTLETVSRLFSRFQKEGLIHIQQRAIRILDHEALQSLIKYK